MGNPAYQEQGDRYVVDGAYGTDYYGWGAYGGHEYPPYEIPLIYLGSDDLRYQNRVVNAGPVHERHGIVVGARTWASVPRWHVVHRGLLPEQVADLKYYWELQTFNLLPDGDPASTSWPVRWITRSFEPKQIRGGRFTLEYDLEGIPS